MRKNKQNAHTSTNLLLGMAAGAAVSAAGLYYANQHPKEMKKMAKKINHTAESAMDGIDKAMGTISHMM